MIPRDKRGEKAGGGEGGFHGGGGGGLNSQLLPHCNIVHSSTFLHIILYYILSHFHCAY